MDKEIHFCNNCFNLTSLHSNEEGKLIHHCKNCGTNEDYENNGDCIFSMDFRKIDKSEIINSNQYITHDRTIPTIKNNINLKCPNEECSTNVEGGEKSFKYVKYDSEDIKYIYICQSCGQKWTN